VSAEVSNPATGANLAQPAPDAPTSSQQQPQAQPQAQPQPKPTSPILFLTADGALVGQPADPTTITLNPADGQTRDGDPYRPIVFVGTDLWLDHTDGSAAFDLPVDAGANIGAGTQVRVSADLTGDGSWDRVETYRYFATDPLPGAEHYTQDSGILSAHGAWGDLRGGIVQMEIWSTLGDTGNTVELGDTELALPYS